MISAQMQPGKWRDKVSICSPPMLPVTCQFFIAMVAHAINERMARRLDYVQKEVRVLREALLTATGKTRIAFTAKQRQRLAIKGMTLPRTNVKAAFSSFDPRRS